MPLILPNDIEVDTTADAIEVEQNYNVIEQYINTNLINRDGSVAMTNPLLLAGDPTQPNQAATKAYTDAAIPVGVVFCFAGGVVPEGRWFLCNGSALATASWPKLFEAIAYKYGGSGASFNLPNMGGRFPVGLLSSDTRFDTVGETGGTFTVPVPQHAHTINHDHAQFNTGTDGSHQHTLATRVTSSLTSGNPVEGAGGSGQSVAVSAAGDHTHTVNVPSYSGSSGNAGTAGATQVQPYVTLNFIIKADPA